MIVWGGQTGPDGGATNTGAIYHPGTDTWTEISLTNAPSARQMHSAIWTGKKMIVWGGCATVDCEIIYNNGGSYDPSTDTWKPVSGAAGMPGRHSHQAVWTGEQMILWGGTSEVRGVAYEPKTGTWTAISAVEAPVPTFQGASVWTGKEMMVWGGCTEYTTGPCSAYVNSGGRYDPALDKWAPVNQQGAPAARWAHTAVLFNGGMFVWGGCGDACYSTGGIYSPYSDAWSQEYHQWGGPAPRSHHAAAGMGDKMAVWGGCDRNLCDDQADFFNGGGIYDLHPWSPDSSPTPWFSPTPSPYLGFFPNIWLSGSGNYRIVPTSTPTPTFPAIITVNSP
jgi:hypothetical protein